MPQTYTAIDYLVLNFNKDELNKKDEEIRELNDELEAMRSIVTEMGDQKEEELKVAKDTQGEELNSQFDRSQPEFANLFAPKEHVKELWEEFSTRDDEMDVCYEGMAKGQRHYCMCPYHI